MTSQAARKRSGKTLLLSTLIVAIGLIAWLIVSTTTTTLQPNQVRPLNDDPTLALTPNITTRTPSSWSDTLYYGNWLLYIMNAPSRTIQQSPWIISNALNLNGWTSSPRPFTLQDDLHSLGLSPAFTALGIPTDYRRWTSVTDLHKATGAKYENIFNKRDRAIVAKHNYSPDYMVREKGASREKVPRLKQWSDVVYLEWLRVAGRERELLRGVQHVFRYDIANKDTQEALRLAMGEGDVGAAPTVPGEWPGSQWSIDEDAAKVALHTSISVGVAYFLAQHKGQLGVRVIDQVNIFYCRAGPGDQWCLYFHIREGPIQ